MRVTWESTDLFCGRRIQKPDCGITGSLIVGWLAGGGTEKYGLISMADGQFVHVGTMSDVADHLNLAGHYVPAECCPDQWMKDRK